MHGASHQYPTASENAAKHIAWGEPGKLVPILFPKKGRFSTIRFPSCGMLYRMEHAWRFQSISRSMEKCSKTHWTELRTQFSRGRELRTFSHRMAIPFHEISTLWYSIRHMIKVWVFP